MAGDIAIVIALALFGMFIGAQIFRTWRTHLVQRTLREAVMRGTELRPEMLADMERTPEFGANDLRNGMVLIALALAIAAGATSLFGRLMAGAVSMIFFTYAFVNMGMVSGILPVVGVPLPFISYGGTAMVTLGLALGVLMSVARAQRLDSKDRPPGM